MCSSPTKISRLHWCETPLTPKGYVHVYLSIIAFVKLKLLWFLNCWLHMRVPFMLCICDSRSSLYSQYFTRNALTSDHSENYTYLQKHLAMQWSVEWRPFRTLLKFRSANNYPGTTQYISIYVGKCRQGVIQCAQKCPQANIEHTRSVI